jgi:kynureninase
MFILNEFMPGKEFALKLDELDTLKDFRRQFYFSEDNTIYLDGNSLGRLPLKTKQLMQEIVEEQWGRRLIRSWNEGWYTLSEKISEKIAVITGADPGEIATGDSTSINLYKLAMAGIQMNKGRKTILSDELNFPTDLYVLQGIIKELGNGYRLKIIPSDDGKTIPETAISEAIDEDTAIVALSHVAFKSGYMHDMEKVNALAHKKGALIIWDLSHAAGAVPLHLSQSGADMAVGCTYKYINGGPGSPAYLFVAKRLQEKISPAICGWFGETNPFAFGLKYHPTTDIRKFMVGTPPIISMAAIEPGLDILLEAGMNNIRLKSVMQSQYLLYLVGQKLNKEGFSTGSPENPDHRGSHISLQHPEAQKICRALINPVEGSPAIIPDFRAPDNIRVGIAPLYNTFTDIFMMVERLTEISQLKTWEKFSDEKGIVT